MNQSKRPCATHQGIFAESRFDDLPKVFELLSKRLRKTRVLCGDWKRVVTTSNFSGHPAAVFLDPPYAHSTGRDTNIYANEMVSTMEVQARAFELGKDDRIRVVLAGQDGEYQLPGWKVIAWSRTAGYARSDQAIASRSAERLWLSPGCLITPEIRRHIRTWRRRSDAADPRAATAKHSLHRKPSNPNRHRVRSRMG